ncbi:MAG: hypothetical protein ABIG84_08320 [archaeon]
MPYPKYHKKGMEQAIWIIITIVVALATALALIILLSTTSSSTETNLITIIEQAGENIRKLLGGK